jgi:hypothetical protein
MIVSASTASTAHAAKTDTARPSSGPLIEAPVVGRDGQTAAAASPAGSGPRTVGWRSSTTPAALY